MYGITEALLESAKSEGRSQARDTAEDWANTLEAMGEVASEHERGAIALLARSVRDAIHTLV